MNTIAELLECRAAETPGSIALLGTDGREPLTFAELASRARRTADALRGFGVDSGCRAAIVLPNGPDLAGCVLGAFLAGQCAPLNPAYSEREFEFYLGDLQARVLVTAEGMGEAARAAAGKLGIRVAEMRGGELDAAGSGEGPRAAAVPQPADVALVLHTSGTTSRPKLVPLTHANLCESAGNIRAAFGLAELDCCLQVMPLFHVHGLIGALLSSIAAGASVVATPGFDPGKFRGWLGEFRPTWYTAVPTIHQAVLRHSAKVKEHSLRFIRSCSSPLPPTVMAALEDAFGVPVVESYGMTEGAHQIATNPLPPLARKPGSVGRAAGPEIAILGESGERLGTGEPGEVAIRGASVTAGYAANPEANRAAFTDSWFRTGDRGYLDEDGYVFLVGRIKEIINRGGEKISPREIDEALLEHPAVAEAVGFAMPDPELGEDVGAAVVLRPGASACESELRAHASARLAYFKIPRRIVILDRIPKGPTGKVQRIGLASRLDLSAGPSGGRAARNRTEAGLLAIWQDVLQKNGFGVDDNFFEVGGDSLAASQVAARVRERLGAEISIAHVFACPTIAELSERVETSSRTGGSAGPVRTRRTGPRVPLSIAQEGMWFMAQLHEDNTPAIRPFLFRLRGAVDAPALEAALRDVADRHEALRTRIVEDDGVPVGLLSCADELRLEARACAGEPEARRFATECLRRSFDLARDLPVRAALARFGDRESLLAIAMHHSCSDGWSNAVFFRELSAAYRARRSGDAPDLPEPPLQYADYVEWQCARLNGAALEAKLDYWKRALAGGPRSIRLPFDRPRPTAPDQRGGLCTARLDARARETVRRAAREQGTTPFVVLLAVLFDCLHRWGGDEDLIVGSPAANRPTPETEQVIGLFMNPIAIRCAVPDGLRLPDLVRRVRDAAMGALEHQDAPLEKVVEVLKRPRERRFEPLYRVGFQLRNLRRELPEFAGVTVQPLRVDLETSFVDLAVEAVECADGIDLRLTYNAALFDRGTAERLLAEYADSAAAVPSALTQAATIAGI